MAACTLFEEDEVCLVTPDKGYVYGIVLENSEYLSSDEEGDDLPGQVKKGTIRVAWHPDGKETVVTEEQVILADRSLMPGDVIRRLIMNEDSQRGYVKDMTVNCHLYILGTDKYIYDVNSKDLLPIADFDPSPGEVTLDSWIGRIEVVNEEVILRFPDGARCIVNDEDFCGFDDVLEKRGRHTEFCNTTNYPGRELRSTLQELTVVKWLNTTSTYNNSMMDSHPRMNIHVTVESVETSSVEVHWVCRGFAKVANPLAKMTPPDRIVKGDALKKLKPLDWFAHCSVQLGDKAYYTIKDTDILETAPPKRRFIPSAVAQLLAEDVKLCSTQSVFKAKKSDSKDKIESTDKCDAVNGAEGVECDDDYEDIEESESDCSSQISNNSGSAPKRKKTGKHSHYLATKLVKKVRGRRARQTLKLPERVVKAGDKVAVEICYTFSQAAVIWQDGTCEDDVPSSQLYPIHHLDDLEYFPGDFIVDGKGGTHGENYGLVVTCDHKERTCEIQWIKPYEIGKATRPSKVGKAIEVSVYDIKDHPDYKFRPGHSVIRVGGFEDRDQELYAVGQVYCLDNGEGVTVKWPDGSTSCCHPQELYIVSDDQSEYGSSEWDSSSSESSTDTDTSWETENEVEFDIDDEAAHEDNENKPFYMLCSHKKNELDVLLERAQTALDKLESLFQNIDNNFTNVSSCCHDILRIYRICKDLDKILKSNFFEEEEITDLISQVRQEIKSEKSRKLAKHLERMFQSWHHGLSENGKDEGQGEELEQSSADDSRGLPSDVERTMCITCVNGRDSPSQGDVITNCTECSKAGDGDSNTSNDSGTEISSNSEAVCDRALARGDSASVKAKSGTASSGADSMANSGDCVANANYVELCLKICRRLNVLMVKIQTEVNARWTEYESSRSDPIATQTEVGDGKLGKVVTSKGSPERTRDDGDKKDVAEPCCDKVKDCDSQTEISGGSFLLPMDVTSKDTSEENVGSSVDPPTTDPPTADLDKIVSSPQVELKECGFKLAEEVEKSEMANSTDPTKGFQIESEALPSHKFRPHEHMATDQKGFMSAVRKEMKLLRTSLPEGILVKGYENRMDLYSVMVIGPTSTPYEDGLFFFDIQLPNDYPQSPPVFHYHSYCSDRLNPNLYEDGKVCVSLLGTWSGKGNETWTSNSNMLQILVSIQGLILVDEPYYNEAGYERQRGSQQAEENSRMYNEMAILKLLQSMTRMVKYPPEGFQDETRSYLCVHGPRMVKRLQTWLELDQQLNSVDSKPCDASIPHKACEENGLSGASPVTDNALASLNSSKKIASPEFPLFPISKGFRLSLRSHLEQYRKALESLQTS